MKGIIPMCLSKMVVEKFGKGKWTESLQVAGLPNHTTFLAAQDIDDNTVMKVVDAVCKVLNITILQAADAFGDYWVNDFASNIYKAYFRKPKSAKEFLMSMNDVHRTTTASMTNAKPPQFIFEDPAPNRLIITYNSERGLVDFFIGITKGVGKFYNEKLHIRKLTNNKVDITFT